MKHRLRGTARVLGTILVLGAALPLAAGVGGPSAGAASSPVTVTIKVACDDSAPSGGVIGMVYSNPPPGTLRVSYTWGGVMAGSGATFAELSVADDQPDVTQDISVATPGTATVAASWIDGNGETGGIPTTTVPIPSCSVPGEPVGFFGGKVVGVAPTYWAGQRLSGFALSDDVGDVCVYGPARPTTPRNALCTDDTPLPRPGRLPVVGIATAPTESYTVVAGDGAVGQGTSRVPWYGAHGPIPLDAPVVGMAFADQLGYWEVASDGGVFSFGDAGFFGSMGGKPLDRPVVGMASVPGGGGYWEVASDGGVFSFGAAHFFGSMGGRALDAPIVGMATTPDGKGYWLVASDGGVFSFGDAPFYGSAGGIHLDAPVVGMTATPDGAGYWLAAADGGVLCFGDAPFLGSPV